MSRRGKSHIKLNNSIVQLFFFISIGASAAFTHWIIAVILIERAAMAALLANVVGWFFAFLISFTGNYFITFKNSGKELYNALKKFLAVSLFGLSLNQLIVYLGLLPTTIDVRILIFVAQLIVAVSSFLLFKFWIFNKK